MDEPNADESVSQRGILGAVGYDGSDAEASNASDANQRETNDSLEVDNSPETNDGPKADDGPETNDAGPSRRDFGKLLLAGTAGALGVPTASASGGQSGWRAGYHEYAREYIPAFYKSVPSKQNLYRCVKYVADQTSFWETLGKRMYLDRAVVTAAYFYPQPNYTKVEKKAWDGILDDMYADMPSKYSKRRDYPVSVPVAVVYLYDGYYNAVAYLQPYGNYKSYGYAIKNGYQQGTSYTSLSDYESNTWWWTEDGWGDAGDTDGGILDGVPTGLVD